MNRNGFELLPHTADIRLRVWGKTIQELFKNALRGMAYYLKPQVFDFKKKPTDKAGLKVEAVDVNSLLVEFLSETIALSDINNTVYTDVVFREFGDNFLEGEIRGFAVDAFDKDIKAVSYHEVDIQKNPQTQRYETILVFDI